MMCYENRTTAKATDTHEGCRLPLNIGFLPSPVDPISKAMACPLRSAGITPLQHYKETALSAGTALGGQVFRRQWFIASMFHSLWVGKAGGELLRRSPPLSGASVLSTSRLEPLVPFPLASPARFSRSIQEPD